MLGLNRGLAFYWIAILLLLCRNIHAHRSLPSGVTCGSQFSSPDEALTIPNTAISWASYRIFDCDDPVFWLDADADAEQFLKFTVTVPVIDRFEDVRMSVVIMGPSLPALAEDADVPGDVQQFLELNPGMGAVLYESPEDQTTCDHIHEVMFDASSVVNERCHFYEPFGGSNSWVVLDEEMQVAEDGMHKIAVFNKRGTPAKAAFACCDWPEDFMTPYDIPEVDCPFCGTNELENPAWSSHYYEQKSMADYAGFPPLVDCAAADSLGLEPGEGQCPALLSDQGNDQPASCDLGCSMDGECHSHNVFGECTHDLTWSLEPKFGDAPVERVVIFKGDKVSFTHDFAEGLAHNLFEMPDQAALDQCDFTEAQAAADVEEIMIGHTIEFSEAGTYHFTCGIGCTGFPEPGTRRRRRLEDEEQESWCHCAVGQKIVVEVKDSTEGMRCHDHVQPAGGGGSPSSTVVSALACPAGQVNAHAINNADYGAGDPSQCAEMCTSPMALPMMGGVGEGSCVDLGYTADPVDLSVQPAGSPMSVQVRVTTLAELAEAGEDLAPLECEGGQVNARAVGNADYGAADETQCAEMCTSPFALPMMTGVEEGSCVDEGFVYDPVDTTVQPAGSPMSVQVRVSSSVPSAAASASSCHCHSYEMIQCPGGQEDPLYREHIDELELHCAGVLDGTEDVCPYKCFQPMEVLHLHYLECPTRPMDYTYTAVDATQKCHIAATAPEGTNCPQVTVEIPEGCPSGSPKTSPGQCGCEREDTDTDNDGMADCVDCEGHDDWCEDDQVCECFSSNTNYLRRSLKIGSLSGGQCVCTD